MHNPPNGRWKLSPITAITIAINLIGWGVTLGTILTKLDALDYRVAQLETRHANAETIRREILNEVRKEP